MISPQFPRELKKAGETGSKTGNFPEPEPQRLMHEITLRITALFAPTIPRTQLRCMEYPNAYQGMFFAYQGIFSVCFPPH
jgi:hypothetical protein